MTTHRRIAATLCALVVAGGAALSAQRPQERRGFWMAFGFGYGLAGFSCDRCSGRGREGALRESRLVRLLRSAW